MIPFIEEFMAEEGWAVIQDPSAKLGDE